MNLILLVVLVGILLLVLGNPKKTKRMDTPVPKEKGYTTPVDYKFDAASVYGAFKK